MAAGAAEMSEIVGLVDESEEDSEESDESEDDGKESAHSMVHSVSPSYGKWSSFNRMPNGSIISTFQFLIW